MDGFWDREHAAATEIRRLKSQGPDRNVIVPAGQPFFGCDIPGRELIGPVSRVIWTGKTAEKLAAIGDVDPRTGGRWISGEVMPPPLIFTAIHFLLTRW